jgi:hypothetical protein
MRQRAGPFTPLHASGFERHIAAGGHDQRERQLGRRHRRIALAGRDRDAELGASGKVDHRRIAADQRDELEFRQPFEQRARELDPLADRDHHVCVAQALDELREIARRLAVARHVMMANERKAFEPIDHILIVVGNSDLHLPGFLGRKRSVLCARRRRQAQA